MKSMKNKNRSAMHSPASGLPAYTRGELAWILNLPLATVDSKVARGEIPMADLKGIVRRRLEKVAEKMKGPVC
jgi:hypothetical protein